MHIQKYISISIAPLRAIEARQKTKARYFGTSSTLHLTFVSLETPRINFVTDFLRAITLRPRRISYIGSKMSKV